MLILIKEGRTMWAKTKNGSRTDSSPVLLIPSEKHLRTKKREKSIRIGLWITEAIILVGALMILGGVGAFSNGNTNGLEFATMLAVGTGIILVGWLTRKYINGRWR